MVDWSIVFACNLICIYCLPYIPHTILWMFKGSVNYKVIQPNNVCYFVMSCNCASSCMVFLRFVYSISNDATVCVHLCMHAHICTLRLKNAHADVAHAVCVCDNVRNSDVRQGRERKPTATNRTPPTTPITTTTSLNTYPMQKTKTTPPTTPFTTTT